MKDYLDLRTLPLYNGGVRGAIDYSTLPPGAEHRERFVMDRDGSGGTIIARRDPSGALTVTSTLMVLEPVMEGESLIGVRFPGSDRYPVQPWDEERDGPR